MDRKMALVALTALMLSSIGVVEAASWYYGEVETTIKPLATDFQPLSLTITGATNGTTGEMQFCKLHTVGELTVYFLIQNSSAELDDYFNELNATITVKRTGWSQTCKTWFTGEAVIAGSIDMPAGAYNYNVTVAFSYETKAIPSEKTVTIIIGVSAVGSQG